MPEIEDRVSHAAKDGGPGNVFKDTVTVSFAFQDITDGSVNLNDVAIQGSRSLAWSTKLALLSWDS
jgi:hypothetical protein